MKPKLTPKQNAFAMALALGTMTQSDAYRAAGYGQGSNPSTIAKHASKLASDTRIVAKVADLQARAMAANSYDLAALQADLLHAARVGMKLDPPQIGGAVRALELVGRMLGAFPRIVEVRRETGRGRRDNDAMSAAVGPAILDGATARRILNASEERAGSGPPAE